MEEMTCYESLSAKRLSDRTALETASPAPGRLSGFISPALLGEGRSDERLGELARQGSLTATRLGVATAIVLGESLGWKRLIDLWCEQCSLGAEGVGRRLRQRFDVRGTSLLDLETISIIGGSGAGFGNAWDYEWSQERVFGVQENCGMVRAACEMQMGDKVGDLRLWCDAYDSAQVIPRAVFAWGGWSEVVHGPEHALGDYFAGLMAGGLQLVSVFLIVREHCEMPPSPPRSR